MDVTFGDTAVLSAGDSAEELERVPHLFLLLETRRPEALSARYRLDLVDEVFIGRGRQRRLERRIESGLRQLRLQVPDPWMSSRHARIERRGELYFFTDAGSTNGSLINGTRLAATHLKDGDILELGQTFFLFRDQLPVLSVGADDVDASELPAPRGLLSLVPLLARRFFELMQIARTPATLMIRGQTGTGKEVIARASHTLSGRSGEFVAVNCGALPETLVESELFGSRKGAFSGATEDRDGLIVAADHGTLFLDEIGDLPLPAQAALLRALQEREVMPVGATRPIPVDFRLISATHRDLEALVRQGRFREDLLARLTGFPVDLPPLCQRMEDIGLLVGTLLSELAQELGRPFTLSNDAMRAIVRYGWPRNIRELRTTLQTAAALAPVQDSAIRLPHLAQPVRDSLDERRGEPGEGMGENPSGIWGGNRVGNQSGYLGSKMTGSQGDGHGDGGRHEHAGTYESAPTLRALTPAQERRREELVALLRQHRGNVSAVARAMGKVRPQVQRWLRRFGLDPDSFR